MDSPVIERLTKDVTIEHSMTDWPNSFCVFNFFRKHTIVINDVAERGRGWAVFGAAFFVSVGGGGIPLI
jgi:hypothetical protein